MIIITAIVTGTAAFLAGFSLGIIKHSAVKTKTEKKTDKIKDGLLKEYENFLNYDGSVQE